MTAVVISLCVAAVILGSLTLADRVHARDSHDPSDDAVREAIAEKRRVLTNRFETASANAKHKGGHPDPKQRQSWAKVRDDTELALLALADEELRLRRGDPKE